MTTCPHCGAATAPDDQFCGSCGNLLPTAPVRPPATPSPDATVLMRGVARSLRSAIALDALFALKPSLVVGRAPDCDVCLPHPSVSRYHALLERQPQGLVLRDLGSVNGVFVGGRRIAEPVAVAEGERVGIGPFLFALTNGVFSSLDSSRSLRLEARGLERVVATKAGPRALLSDVNLVVEPGEFVALLGPSGSGKSTLMDALNGRRRASGGCVLANGEDFYRHFDSFRQSLGYVPQKDIVHAQLTVAKALTYTARLRLPHDTVRAEVTQRVEEVLREMELTPHRDTLVGSLSGGQVKRVSLGAELLARPCLLYVDEATSGLDAGTEARMMGLFRRLADEGRSLVCITHNVDNVDRCHLVLVLMRGRLVYCGPPAEAPPFFGVPRLGDIYDRLSEREPDDWVKAFAASSLHAEFVAKRLEATPTPATTPPPSSPSVSGPFGRALAQASLAASASGQETLAKGLRGLTSRYLKSRELVQPVLDAWRQFLVLTARYAELLIGDRRSLRLLALQAPLVGLFLLFGFAGKPYEREIPAPRRLTADERAALEHLRGAAANAGTPAEELLDAVLRIDVPVVPDLARPFVTDPTYNYMLLYIVAVAVMWFGCNNASKEIVKEEAIYGRERAVNLGVVPYLASKFLLLTVASALQTLVLLLVLHGGLEALHAFAGHALPHPAYRLTYFGEFGVLALLSSVGVATGLLLSAFVSSPDRANALLPYVLIPQIILGGGMLSVDEEPLRTLAPLLSPVYWAFRGIRRGATTLPRDLPFAVSYDDRLWIVIVALAVQAAALLLATAWALRRKDAR